MKRIFEWRPNKRQRWIIILAAIVLFLLFESQGTLSDAAFEVWGWISTGIRTPVEFVLAVAFVVVLVVLIGGYRYHWTWTGFGNYTAPKIEGQDSHARKTLWDWMQLIIIPAVLAGAALSFNAWNSSTQLKIADDNKREAALQTYMDKMSELMLDKGLLTSKSDDEIRNVARTRTLTVLRTLDGERRGILLQFIYDSHLITPTVMIDLNGANLNQANILLPKLNYASLKNVSMDNAQLVVAELQHADLTNAFLNGTDLTAASLEDSNLRGASLIYTDLQGAYLNRSDLSGANLTYAKLDFADLTDADLTDATLTDATLEGANLKNAKVTLEQLAKARSLKGATMPNGSKHD
jgi:uncharacterized protein YjbI with pentapeptide repeats